MWILCRTLRKMSILVKIYDTETPREIAEKIFYKFDISASCSIYGFYMDEFKNKLVPKGELVLEQLRTLDEIENCRYTGNKKIRNYKYRKDSIGGTIAQKIFTYEVRVVEKEPRYTIWRYQ